MELQKEFSAGAEWEFENIAKPNENARNFEKVFSSYIHDDSDFVDCSVNQPTSNNNIVFSELSWTL